MKNTRLLYELFFSRQDLYTPHERPSPPLPFLGPTASLQEAFLTRCPGVAGQCRWVCKLGAAASHQEVSPSLGPGGASHGGGDVGQDALLPDTLPDASASAPVLPRSRLSTPFCPEYLNFVPPLKSHFAYCLCACREVFSFFVSYPPPLPPSFSLKRALALRSGRGGGKAGGIISLCFQKSCSMSCLTIVLPPN
jgi:hypothetical protein